MSAAAPEPAAAGPVRTNGETQAIIRSIVGTGISLATLMLMLAGLMIQQNASLNARIDELNASLNARIDELNASLNARIDDVDTSLNARIDDVNTSLNARIDDVNARIDDMNARIDDLQEDVRELRALLIDTIKRIAPAD